MTTHYTILPQEVVFAGFEEHSPDYKEININGLTMVVEMTAMNEGRIVRLISPNPYDYLNPLYAPGRVVSFSAQLN